MKEMKYKNSFLIFILFILINFSIKAQNTSSPFLMRATLGASGSSETVTFDNLNFIIQQSIDQSSVIGTSKNNGYTLRQGFIQPNVLGKILDTSMPIDLEANFYPNPFTEKVSLAFAQQINGHIEVAVFDMVGKLVFLKKYAAVQNLQLQFDNLSLGAYILKITANNRQLIKNIMKVSFN